jgi:hypothetical protein
MADAFEDYRDVLDQLERLRELNSAADESALSTDQEDAYVSLVNLFDSYGLGTLAPRILELVQSGYSADTIAIQLQQTEEYQRRFIANKARVAAGLNALSPAEYISTERAYRQVMIDAGLPTGFYDSQSDFEKFLERDISPTEIQSRVAVVQDALNNADAATMNYFKQFYNTGDIVAYALDPERASSVLEKRYRASQVAGAASGQGLRIDQATAESLASQGVTQETARSGFGFVASELPTVEKMSSIYGGEDVTMQDLVSEAFTGNAAAAQKRSKLASQERAAFSGKTGAGKSTLSKARAGQL